MGSLGEVLPTWAWTWCQQCENWNIHRCILTKCQDSFLLLFVAHLPVPLSSKQLQWLLYPGTLSIIGAVWWACSSFVSDRRWHCHLWQWLLQEHQLWFIWHLLYTYRDAGKWRETWSRNWGRTMHSGSQHAKYIYRSAGIVSSTSSPDYSKSWTWKWILSLWSKSHYTF